MDSVIEGLNSFFGLAPLALQAGMAMIAAASTVTALTPTPRDDQMIGKLYRVIEMIALNIGRAKDLPPNQLGGRFTPS
ncbi:MAG: hypothetical protein AAFU68_10090 [Pseudomonadota bacterium]